MCWKVDGVIEVDHIEVHHRIKLTPENVNNPAIALNWKNMIALCKKHHDEMHGKLKQRTDPDGRVTL